MFRDFFMFIILLYYLNYIRFHGTGQAPLSRANILRLAKLGAGVRRMGVQGREEPGG
jgi:hypothetical protein